MRIDSSRPRRSKGADSISHLSLRDGRPARLAEDVLIAGYPLGGILSSGSGRPFGCRGPDGLGLDSIDMLEMSLVISKQYGFELKSDVDNKAEVFGSLRGLTTHIARCRTK